MVHCFSFYATKNPIGEGGMLITHQKKLYDRARFCHWNGQAGWNRYGKQGYDIMMFQKLDKYNLMDLIRYRHYSTVKY